MAFIANTPDDVHVMLEAIGLDSLDDLFDMIPPEYRLDRPLAIPRALGELELTSTVGALLGKNAGADVRPCFLGGGCYDHFIPAVVDNLASRGEFYTAYTPYQPEASQGTLQATFEYQTLIAELTGHGRLERQPLRRRLGRRRGDDDGDDRHRPARARRRRGFGPSRVSPDPRDLPGEPRAGACHRPRRRRAGRPTRPLAGAVTDDTAAVVIQHPNFFGQLEDVEALVDVAHAKGRWRS